MGHTFEKKKFFCTLREIKNFKYFARLLLFRIVACEKDEIAAYDFINQVFSNQSHRSAFTEFYG